MSDLFTGQHLQETECIIVKYLTNIECFNHCSMTKFTPNQLSKVADTSCLL